MEHGSQRYWFCPILRCFKLVFFGEALQRSEIYLLKCIQMAVSCGRPSHSRENIEAPLICTGAATPMRDDTDLAPLVTKDGAEKLSRQVNESTRAGARILIGGSQFGSSQYFAMNAAATRLITAQAAM
jgi:hypothetical protein